MTPKEYTFDAAYQPQVRAKRGTREIMLDVIIALLPALCVGVWQFGAQALIPLAVSIVSCVFFEWAYRKLMKKPDSIGDLSAVVTGILLAYTLPANCKWWLPIIGAFFAIVVVKQLYGGIGKNFLNPALAGRAFLLASYALFMTTWVVPGSLTSVIGADATTMATPLSYMKAGEALPQYFTYKSMFLGTMPGCLGEVSALALLIGGVYLLCRKVITWHIPVSFIGTVALLTLIFGSKNGGGYTHVEWMLDNLLSGGLLRRDRVRPLPDPWAGRGAADPLGRSAAGRVLHGDRLQHQPRHRSRPHHLRRRLRRADRAHPRVRRLPGGRFLCHPHHELLRMDVRQAHPAPSVRRQP